MINLIFDLDGCLIDSSDVQKTAFFGAYKEVVGDNNCPSFEDYMKFTGDSVDNVMKKLNLPNEMASIFRRISSECIDKVKVNWDLIDLIKFFRAKGCRIAICTGKDRYRTVDILKYFNIDSIFNVLICADDVKQHKPLPEPIFKALEELGCSSNEAVVIGDGYSDICSAKAAGVKSILSLWYGDNGVPREADYIANNIIELSSILNTLV